MQFNQLVEINQKGLLARAVSFDRMGDAKDNLTLCEGFVFNHDTDRIKAKNTTVGVLDVIRRSFHSRNEENVHLMIQDYGKGKSHFALAVANFFKLPSDSAEVQGILDQLKSATSKNDSILADLTAYKQRGRHLVMCLSGERAIDLRKQFLQVLNKELEAQGVVDSIAQNICQEPLQFLQRLDTNQRSKIEPFLDSKGRDLIGIIHSLTENNFRDIPLVKDIHRQLFGTNPDFSSDVDIEVIFKDLIDKLCNGENPKFQGILILFDEMNRYLETWASDPVGAGMTLQNITNACESHKGKMALISFAQKSLNKIVSSKNADDCKKLVSRIQTSSTYNPKASLELVLDGLLRQKETSDWQSFLAKRGDELKRLSTNIFSKYAAESYSSLNWRLEEFHKHLTLGCFPLHPMTSYLLCNLAFTQGRSAVDFVREEVKEFISSDRPVETNGKLNLIYPIALVKAFEDNFSNREANTEYVSVFSEYKSAFTKVETSADAKPEEIDVLKAILLYYTSSGRLKKSDHEKHEEILSLLTGLSTVRLSEILEKLCKVREVIYLNQADNTYRFWSGSVGITELRQKIKDETRNIEISIATVEGHCSSNITNYVGQFTTPKEFIEIKKLRSEDWQFENKVYTIASFRTLLQRNQPFKTPDYAGIVAYIIAETSEEIAELYSEIVNLIEQHSYRCQIAVAIAAQPVENLARLISENEAASKYKVQDFGAALTQLKEQYAKQIKTATEDLFKSFTNHAYLIDQIPLGDRKYISIVVSEILKHTYTQIPPIEGLDKLALKSTVGSNAIKNIAKRLLDDDLRPQILETSHRSIVDSVFVKSWGLLQLVNQKYKVLVPSQSNVKAAWDKLSETTALGERDERTVDLTAIWETLSAAPYGYNAYTFTVLLVSWMVHHRSEIFLKGTFGITNANQQTVRIEPLKAWVDSNIFEKPKDFINKWILIKRPQLIRRKPLAIPTISDILDSDRAKQTFDEVTNFLAKSPDPEKYRDLNEKSQSLERAITKIDRDFEPVVRVEELLESVSVSTWNDVETFINLYSDLQKPLLNTVEGGITVCPSDDYLRRYTLALQSAIEKIGQAIDIESERHTTLSTEANCGAHKANLQSAIARLEKVENLPERFIESLRDALHKTESVQNEITERKRIEECESQIERLYTTLNETSTQQNYVNIQSQIDELVNIIPLVKERSIYQNTIELIREKQDSLVQQFAVWESQYDLSISRDRASALKDQITPQKLRYTDQSSLQRLDDLLKRLDDIILDRQTQEREEERLEKVLVNARGKLNDMKALNNTIDVMKAYLNLSALRLPSVANHGLKQQELQDNKSEGFTVVSQKLQQIFEICKRKLEQPKEYEQRKLMLQRTRELATTSDEFTSFLASIAEASQELDAQYQILQKRIEDTKIVQSIRQHSLPKANTLHLCEEVIAEIETVRQRLNHPDQFAEEINKQVDAFRAKITGYADNLQSLRSQLLLVSDRKQLGELRDRYNQLNHVFRDSSQFSTYQQFQEQIHQLETDINIIVQLQELSAVERTVSLSACDHAIAQIDLASPTLLATERFADRLQQLKDTLLQRKQSYVSQLTEFQDGLSNATTSKESKKVREQIGKVENCYQNSEEEQNYKSIYTETDLLVEFLQILEVQKKDTPENCDAEFSKLRQWQEANVEVSLRLRSRVESALQELDQTRQKLQESQRRSVQSWFNSILKQRTEVEQNSDPEGKIAAASKLLKQVKKQRQQHEQLLEETQKQELDNAIIFCDEIQSQDREAKILNLFQELPKAKRESLHKLLAQYLESTTEEL
jgi:hypothetical protein